MEVPDGDVEMLPAAPAGVDDELYDPPEWLVTPALKAAWALFRNPANRSPKIVTIDGKLYLEDSGSVLATYGGYFDISADDGARELLLSCRVGGCDANKLKITRDGKLNFSNAATHITSHLKGITTLSAAGASASSAATVESAAKRARVEEAVPAARGVLEGSAVINGATLTKEQLKVGFAEMVVMGLSHCILSRHGPPAPQSLHARSLQPTPSRGG